MTKVREQKEKSSSPKERVPLAALAAWGVQGVPRMSLLGAGEGSLAHTWSVLAFQACSSLLLPPKRTSVAAHTNNSHGLLQRTMENACLFYVSMASEGLARLLAQEHDSEDGMHCCMLLSPGSTAQSRKRRAEDDNRASPACG